MTHQRRNKPESTEALVERVQAGIGPIAGPGPWDREEAALSALTELTERLAAAEATRKRDDALVQSLLERAEAAERQRDDARARYDQLISDLGGTLP